VVIFDGASEDRRGTQERKSENVIVRYTREGQEADEMILQLARRARKSSIQIITTDRKLAQSLQQMGVKVCSNREFEITVQHIKTAWSSGGFDNRFGRSIAERIDRKSWNALKKARAKLIADGY
jgi:predicted RNA-binding protein with PIN domain